MPYDAGLAQRTRRALADETGFEERKMFGGIAFMLNGNMACGVIGDDLIVRVGKEHYEQALEQEHCREFNFTGRPMTGWVLVSAAGIDEANSLKGWVRQGVSTAQSLPAK